MQKFEIQLNLEHIKQARKAYNDAAREFGERVDKAMKRLIHEAAAQRMSITEVGKLSGFTSAQVKARMKAMNLNPTTGKTLLSKQAADVLTSNAAIMGIEPSEIDLMSPLAYLPAGSLLKDKAQSKGVTDIPAERDEFLETKARINADIHLGFNVEEDWDGPSIKPGTLTDEQVEWLSSWLTGCGLGYKAAQRDEAGA